MTDNSEGNSDVFLIIDILYHLYINVRNYFFRFGKIADATQYCIKYITQYIDAPQLYIIIGPIVFSVAMIFHNSFKQAALFCNRRLPQTVTGVLLLLSL